MRSDAKLGMALGMLVAGFAIAFCFPREGRVSVAEQVVLNQKPVQSEKIEFVPIHELRTGTNLVENDLEFSPDDVPDVVGPDPESELNDAPLGSEPFETDTSAIDANSSLKTLLTDDINDDNSSEASDPSDTTPNTYLVQQGDTLSEISMKTLGSYRRYLDIYESNRDQLDSPNDLRPGMILNIPVDQDVQKSLIADKTVPEEVLPPEVGQPVKDDDAESPKRFGNRGKRPFLSDRRHQIPVHQIPSKQAQSHIVESGDTLEKIAVRYFGTVRAIRQIHAANPGLLDKPNQLKPGTVLKLVP